MKFALITILFCVCVPFVFAGDFVTEVMSTGAASAKSPINVPANHFIRIRNFTQDTNGTRGTVSVKFGSSATGITVMTASFATTANVPALEPTNSVVIAGPATVTITGGTSLNTVVTYIKEKDSD